MAAVNPTEIFTDDWSWFVPQADYDELNRQIIEFLDEVHLEIGPDLDSLIAYQLIKSDLSKELVCFSCAMIDTSAAKKNQLQLVYGPAETLVDMITRDSFTDYSIIGQLRAQPALGIRERGRNWLASQKRRYIRNRVSNTGTIATVGLNINPLGSQLAPDDLSVIRFLMPDLRAERPRRTTTPSNFIELADSIVNHVLSLLSSADIEVTSNASDYLRRTIRGHFDNAWADFSMKSLISSVGAHSSLLTGTGGHYPARVIAQQFWKEGAMVVRTSHGGDVPMFYDHVVPSTELPFSSTYVVFGAEGAAAYGKDTASRSEAKLPMYPKRIEAVGSSKYAAIWKRSSPLPADVQPKNITVLSASFTGAMRAVPHKKVHDVVYLEWHRRLLRQLSDHGYSVLAKRHPKALLSDRNIFDGLGVEELTSELISSVEQRTDAFIIDTIGSALPDILCTGKPVVIIDFGVKRITTEARTLLNGAAKIVTTRFDENNRITINMSELVEAINAPVDLEARERFVSDYLLTPSEGISTVREELATHG